MNSKWPYIVSSVFCASGFAGFFLRVFSGCNLLADMANLALIFTLAILILYTFSTYKLASEAWIPIAPFSLEQSQPIPYNIAFQIRNYSKFSLECWCNINATVYGQPVPMDGFYGEKSSWTLQP
jgi:hypothetical protein